MEFNVNNSKNLEIVVNDITYLRHAIKTHYVKVGDNYMDIIEKYVKDVYEEGDILSISEKIIALCQNRVVYAKDLKIGLLAKFISFFAAKPEVGGMGAGNIYKMQFTIDLCGPLKVIYAAIAGGICKLFGKKGIYYEILGKEISGIDGFYPSQYKEYVDMGIRIPDRCNEVCNEIYDKFKVKAMIVDACEFGVEIFGKCDELNNIDDEVLKNVIRDNPACQDKEQTPLILIRKK